MSAQDALKKYSQKALGQGKRKPRGKNKTPEKTTEKACMEWFFENGFSMHVVEAKAVWSKSANRYLTGQVAPGFSDSAGCTPEGIGCFVEFKAKDRRSTLRDSQREFLREKIIKGCFAVVVDRVEHLEMYYKEWMKIRRKDLDMSIGYLLSILPKEKKSKIEEQIDEIPF